MSVHIKLPKCGQGWLTNVRHIANVDWALINFIEDWFPVEARKKLRANEKEAAEEQLEELGLTPEDVRCVVM